MTSLDSNLLLYAYDVDCPFHPRAIAFLRSIQHRDDLILSEFSLVEFYRLLRNAAILRKPLTAPEATEVINAYRAHPRWRIAGFPSESQRLHDDLWQIAAQPGFPYRRIVEARLALALRQFGVTEFATANVKDFQGFGFEKVWNPLT